MIVEGNVTIQEDAEVVLNPGTQANVLVHSGSQTFTVGKDAVLRLTVCMNDKATQRTIVLKGEGAQAFVTEIFFGSGAQDIGLTTKIIHAAPHTTSRVLTKGILKEQAHVTANGMVKIEKVGQHSDSFLAQHVLLLDEHARADTIPNLEIEADEVKASHAATVSPINEEQVFYLMARGLAREEAKRMIALGFLNAHTLPEPVQQELHRRLSCPV